MIQINDLKKISMAPAQGHMLVYTRQRVVFETYCFGESGVRNALAEQFINDEILELHLFDSKCEYRAISTDSKRIFDGSAQGTIEHMADFHEETDIYKKRIMLERACGPDDSIIVLNHISCDEKNGMATVDDYRLAMEG